jgi:predicted metal-binding protein
MIKNLTCSNVGLGAFLHQLEDDEKLRVISFASRILKGPKCNYYANELEALVIVWALEKW